MEDFIQQIKDYLDTISLFNHRHNGVDFPKININDIEGASTFVAGVSSVTGTTNQVVASAPTGAVTLSLPQSIATTSTPRFSRLGLSIGADSSAVMIAVGQYFSLVFGNSAITVATNIDWNAGNRQTLNLSATTTLTFLNPKAGATYTLEVQQAGGFLITWPSVKWVGATQPVLTSTAGAFDIISFFYDGTYYFGTYSLNFN